LMSARLLSLTISIVLFIIVRSARR
jgi:hypothetical protein